MKNKILFSFIFIFILLFAPFLKVSASELCSSNGYTVLTVNGIFTDENGAIYNRNKLASKFTTTYNNQNLKVDYIYNPTHLAGAGDLIDVVAQGVFDQKSDYDLTEMLNDASQKVTTQKLLLVAHSQGNFYANNFYDKTASKPGGVPSQSIGVYSVATPADRVAGGGKYLTSDTDGVIAATVGRFIKILSPNTHIALQNGDDKYGHSFTDVYLKYQSDRIVSDVKSSLDKLEVNDEQEPGVPCISPPELSIAHKVEGVILAVADPTASVIKNGIVGAYDAGVYVADGVYNIGAVIGNGVHNTGVAIGNSVRNTSLAISNMFTNLTASVIGTNTKTVTTALPNLSEPAKDNLSSNSLAVTNNIKLVDIIPASKNPVPIQASTITPVKTIAVIKEPLIPIPIPIPIPNPNPSPKIVVISTTQLNENMLSIYRGGGEVVDSPATDTTPPIISIIGVSSVNVAKDTVYTDAGATANDAIDGVRTVTTTGTVDTATIGTYTITYTASDLSNNISTLTRTVNVVDSVIPDITPPVITMNGDSNEVALFYSVYADPGATAVDAVDGAVTVTTTGRVETSVIGTYTIAYTTTDSSGNTATATRTVKVSTFKYIPKYKFGTDNGDGRDWQVFLFNGSNVYDWSDTYVDNYLHEQFKIQDYNIGDSCTQCLQRGIFNHNPQQGFEDYDVILSELENNPQSKQIDMVYDVALQWDLTGYVYTISHNGITDATGHTDIANVNENMWVGWDGQGYFAPNNFTIFPSGDWSDSSSYPFFPPGYTGGGSSMVLQPYPVYVYSGPAQSNQKIITGFNFNGLNPSVTGNIDEAAHTVSLTVPFGTDVTNLIPTIAISDKASISTSSGSAQNFANPVIYTVTAENNSTQTYTATVTIASDPNPPADTTPPIISALSISPSSGYVKIGDVVTLSITADSAGYTAQAININNVAATNFIDNGNGTYTAVYTVSSGDNDVTAGAISASVALTDASGNSNVAYTTVAVNTLKIDANDPTLISAQITSANTVDLTFSEDLNGQTVSNKDFTVAGHTLTLPDASEINGVVHLTVSDVFISGETPEIIYNTTVSNGVKDLAGNIAPEKTVTANSI